MEKDEKLAPNILEEEKKAKQQSKIKKLLSRPSLFNVDVKFYQSKEERIASLNGRPNLAYMLSSTKERHQINPIREQNNYVYVEHNIKKDDAEIEKPILESLKQA